MNTSNNYHDFAAKIEDAFECLKFYFYNSYMHYLVCSNKFCNTRFKLGGNQNIKTATKEIFIAKFIIHIFMLQLVSHYILNLFKERSK